MINLTEKVLNSGVRPHLTKWQAKYRKWYEENKGNKEGMTPQEIQKLYPLYRELEKDLIKTNQQIIEYEKIMEQMAFS